MRRTSDDSFSFLFFIEVYLIYSVVFVPGSQQSDSYTYAFIYIYMYRHIYIYIYIYIYMASQVVLVVENQ